MAQLPTSTPLYPPQPGFTHPPPIPGWQGPVDALSLGTNGLAIASLVLGIVWLWGVGSILALVLGYTARNQIRDTGGRQGGNGMAIAGIVLGWIGVGIILLLIAALVLATVR